MTADWNLDRERHGADRRATVRLMYYWLSLRRVGNLPLFADFDPRCNPVRWEICFLVHLPPEGEPGIEHLGADFDPADHRAAALGPSGMTPHRLLGLALDGLDTVRRTALPYRRDGSLMRGTGRALRYRSILLPFADGAGQLRRVLGAVSHCLDAVDPARIAEAEQAGAIPVRPAAIGSALA